MFYICHIVMVCSWLFGTLLLLCTIMIDIFFDEFISVVIVIVLCLVIIIDCLSSGYGLFDQFSG